MKFTLINATGSLARMQGIVGGRDVPTYLGFRLILLSPYNQKQYEFVIQLHCWSKQQSKAI